MSLAEQQSRLLQAMFEATSSGVGAIDFIAACAGLTAQNQENAFANPLAGLAAYRNNGMISARAALRAAYPVSAALLELEFGEHAFKAAARDLWLRAPPHLGDWADWGAGLGEALRAQGELSGAPYLPDLCALEWAMHRAAYAPNVQVDPSSFACLTNADESQMQNLTWVLSPGLCVHRSVWPVGQLLLGCTEQGANQAIERWLASQNAPPFDEVSVVSRRGLRPLLTLASEQDSELLLLMASERNLAQFWDALEGRAAPDPLDFAAGFARAVERQWVVGIASYA